VSEGRDVAAARRAGSTSRLIHQLLEVSAREHSEHIAVVDRDRSFTYAELDADSTRIANLLRALSVERGDRIGLYLEKSYEAVVGIYAVLKVGAVYVPLDTKAPATRLAYIVGNCGVRCVLTERAKQRRWNDLAEPGGPVEHFVVLDAAAADGSAPPGVKVHGTDFVADAAPASLPPEVSEDDLAYILYTSGSTGQPKGVMLSHRNAMAFVDWAVDAVALGREDRVSSHAPFQFDLSVFDLYATAAAGATLVLVPAKASVFPVELARFVRETRISVWYAVPSVFTMLVEHAGLAVGDLPALRTVIFAGEVFPTRYLSRLMSLLPHAVFWNFYGPTETNVCTAYRVPAPPDPDGPDIPIGLPIQGVEGIVLSDDGTLADRGAVGELLIGGPTVMRGYWADPEKTAERLVRHPTRGADAGCVYRTGDLVAEGPDGNYRFVGRRDNQIKSRGYRIELGEIETALNAHAGVRECAVSAVPDPLITNRIHAHVVVRDDTGTRELAAFCAERLPRYMVPDHFEVLDALPRTNTGKIDRQALLPPPPS
jgi:amino acid adenylation domain-containing protein